MKNRHAKSKALHLLEYYAGRQTLPKLEYLITVHANRSSNNNNSEGLSCAVFYVIQKQILYES